MVFVGPAGAAPDSVTETRNACAVGLEAVKDLPPEWGVSRQELLRELRVSSLRGELLSELGAFQDWVRASSPRRVDLLSVAWMFTHPDFGQRAEREEELAL